MSARDGRSILVTGANSPIGERLIRTFLDDPSVEAILAVSAEPEERALPVSAPGRLHYVQVDLRRPREMHRLLFGPARDLGVDTVLHTAHHHSPFRGGRGLHTLNVDSTRELLVLCERHPSIQRFVYRSGAEVYQVQADLPALIEEDHPLNLGSGAPQWIRDRVEADLMVCMRMGLSSLHMVVLRFAECLAPGTGSQLHDYLQSPVCLQPMGYNPMVNVITLADVVRALTLATRHPRQGIFNVPGRDTLPLHAVILKWGRVGVPVPSGLLTPLYAWRSRMTGSEFRYGMNRRRFHYSGILDGTRARTELGYVPLVGVDWPVDVQE